MRTSNGIHAAVFDVGGVLIEWDPRHLYRKLLPDDPEAMERFLGTVCTPEWNLEQDRGRSFAKGVDELSRRHPHAADLIAAYDTRWEEMVPHALPGTPELLGELRDAGVPCYGLTNFSAEKFPLVQRRFAFLRDFDGVLVSGEEGVVKPDPEIFRLLTERFDLEPARTLFIDDRIENTDAAARLGFYSHRFTSAAALHAELRELGLLE